MVLLSDADRRTTTNRPAGFFTSHNPSQCVFKIKTGDGIGCAKSSMFVDFFRHNKKRFKETSVLLESLFAWSQEPYSEKAI